MQKSELPSMYELCLMHARTDRSMRGLVAKQLETQQLTMMEWLALGVISTGSKNGLSMSEVATTLDVTLPQVTALVASLLTHKYIKQKVLSSDHRGRQVSVTLKGRRVLTRLEATIEKSMRQWTQAVPASRLQEYLATVEQLSKQAD